MLPLCQERQTYSYAGYTIVIVVDDHEWSAAAWKRGRRNAEILAGWHPQAHLAAQEMEGLIDERVRAEAAAQAEAASGHAGASKNGRQR
jgi:hypothetical protein